MTRPSLGVSVGVWRGARVLLIRRGQPPYRDAWTFPGGRVEWGETLAEAARREVREETGLGIADLVFVHPLEFVGARDPAGTAAFHTVLMVHAARSDHGEPRAGDDAAEARFVDPAAIAGLVTTPGLMTHVAATRAALTRP